MKFNEMQYIRPDIEDVKSKIKKLVYKLEKAESYGEAKKLFLDMEKIKCDIGTAEEIAGIRNSINTKDEYYDKELKFWSEAKPEITEYFQQWNKVFVNTPFKKEFAAEYGDLMFLNIEINLKSFSPDIIDDLKLENELKHQYEKLISQAQIEFYGKSYTLSGLGVFKECVDDEKRLAAWKAEGQWFKDNREELDRIYDGLVKIRDKMGKKLGYKDFTELGYYRMGRNCYTKEDIEKFRKLVVEYLVPVADKLFREQAERLGKEYPMSFSDNAIKFKSGNAFPCGNANDIIAHAKKMYDDLSPETSEFFNKMLECETMDLLSKPGKMSGGYCTGIPDYKIPFIFANFNGTSGDVEVVTHEAGHAFEYYMNRNRVPFEYCWPSMEACEVHSMSMEFLAWPYAEGFFGKDTKKFYYSHLAGSICFIPYGTMVDDFQHIIYEKPDMTPQERHDTWKNLIGIYMPWMKLDGDIPTYGEGYGWQRQLHIYGMPFYYIDYCLAQTVALEIWMMEQENFDNAWKHYMDYTLQGGSNTFTNLLKNADIESPFNADIFKKVCSTVEEWLKRTDMKGL